MIVFKDMCFCMNDTCKKRNKCARALENYSDEDKKDHYFSMANFNCNAGSNMFCKVKFK